MSGGPNHPSRRWLTFRSLSDLYDERTFVLTRQFVKRACEFPPQHFEKEVQAYFLAGLPSTGPGALGPIVEQARALLAESERSSAAELEGAGKRKAGEMEAEADAEEEGEDARERERPMSEVVRSMRVLTEGACLSLRRTLVGLEAVLAAKGVQA